MNVPEGYGGSGLGRGLQDFLTRDKKSGGADLGWDFGGTDLSGVLGSCGDTRATATRPARENPRRLRYLPPIDTHPADVLCRRPPHTAGRLRTVTEPLHSIAARIR